MTTNRTQKLKYLGVEMLKKDATKSSKPEVGLFRGLRERSVGEGADAKSIRLILLGVKDKENDLKALNLDIFNVLSMKMLYGDTKELIVFKATDADQEKAMELLNEALSDFQEEKRMVDNDPEIVDVSTFDDVPQEFFSPKETKPASTQTPSYGYGGYNSACGYQDTDWQKKQKEREEEKKRQDKLRWTPTLISRKGELPGVKVLNAIKKKVQLMAAGEYEYELTDPDPDDTFEDKKTTA
jgi:hypothetical protein